MSMRHSAILLGVLGVYAGFIPPVAAQESGTLGFVIRDWFTAMYESRFMDECPEGLNQGNDEFWWRSMTREERAKATGNGLLSHARMYYMVMGRGPNHEDVCMNPTLITDPPLRTVEGKLGYGDNLDGTDDGHATPKSCTHQKFTSPDGATGIDNQFYRLVGCTLGWRKDASDRVIDLNANETRGTSGLGMILVEITGVKDPRNSDNVTVTFYRSVDQYALDSTGKPLPFSGYKIDTVNGKPRYGDSLKGSIKNGVLETQRGDITLPYYGSGTFSHPVIKDMALHMEIAPDGRTATGMVTGYYDVEQFMYALGGIGQFLQVALLSCPAMYVAAHQLADGYPDPKTGECTSLSSAFNIKAYAAFVLHPEKDRREAAR